MSTPQHASLKARSGRDLILEDIKVSGDLCGLMLDMQVMQRFVNFFATQAEIVYTFPLPWGAVLFNVEVKLGISQLAFDRFCTIHSAHTGVIDK